MSRTVSNIPRALFSCTSSVPYLLPYGMDKSLKTKLPVGLPLCRGAERRKLPGKAIVRKIRRRVVLLKEPQCSEPWLFLEGCRAGNLTNSFINLNGTVCFVKNVLQI